MVEFTVSRLNLEKLANKYFGSLKTMFCGFAKKKKGSAEVSWAHLEHLGETTVITNVFT